MVGKSRVNVQKIVVHRRHHRRRAASQVSGERVQESLQVALTAIHKMPSLVLLGYDTSLGSLWQHAWLATGLWTPSSPAHKGDVLYAAALQNQRKIETILAPHHTGFVLQIHGGYEEVSEYLVAQQRRFRVLFIDRHPHNEAERDSIRACRRYWQQAAAVTLHASQIADDHRVFWDALETLGYPLKKRSTFFWPPSAVPPVLPS
jgi:hypothetical protein